MWSRTTRAAQGGAGTVVDRLTGDVTGRVSGVSQAEHQRYRFRAPSTGREIIIEAEPGRVYVDRESGEDLQCVAKVLPLLPSRSHLPWSVENLRFCNWCSALAQRDLNDCPTCERRMGPIA